MNPLVYHVASGQCFFTGIVLLIAAALLRLRTGDWWRRLAWLSLIFGALAVALSSTAIPYWLYAIAIAVTLPWFSSYYPKDWSHWAPHAMIAGWLFAAAAEVPYHASPTIKPVTARAIAILGDSVTAGVDGDEKSITWPKLLAREHQLEVQDISHVGETAASALKRVRKLRPTAPLVVVEIGGNDLLGSTTAAQFDHDLNALLAELKKTNRQIIMFELPLPPFYHEYGRVQRAAAARHGVALVPKRVLLSILAGNGSTLDTIHLSQAGHKQMARTVWQLIGPAYP
jgi:acyl-CoA thioesterase-1